METILIELELPAINETRDFLFPAHIPLGALLDELVATVASGTTNALVDAEHPVLLNKATRRQLDENKTLFENGITDGGALILV